MQGIGDTIYLTSFDITAPDLSVTDQAIGCIEKVFPAIVHSSRFTFSFG
jgi:glutamate dehydrogenase/leucine dehydrogenase